MRFEQVKRAGLVAATMDLAFVAGVLLSMGGTPSKHSAFFIEAGKPEAAELATAAPDGDSPREEIADSANLDLQLD
ncbi:MAG TPA: hypothetical protein VFZ57_07805 [Thermoanaerobaculia bacterium]|nr:hypothetical protein [Thermoanaerobaculia bacterium]